MRRGFKEVEELPASPSPEAIVLHPCRMSGRRPHDMTAVKTAVAYMDDEESRTTPRSFHSGFAPSLTLPRTPTQACPPRPPALTEEMVLCDASLPKHAPTLQDVQYRDRDTEYHSSPALSTATAELHDTGRSRVHSQGAQRGRLALAAPGGEEYASGSHHSAWHGRHAVSAVSCVPLHGRDVLREDPATAPQRTAEALHGRPAVSPVLCALPADHHSDARTIPRMFGQQHCTPAWPCLDPPPRPPIEDSRGGSSTSSGRPGDYHVSVVRSNIVAHTLY